MSPAIVVLGEGVKGNGEGDRAVEEAPPAPMTMGDEKLFANRGRGKPALEVTFSLLKFFCAGASRSIGCSEDARLAILGDPAPDPDPELNPPEAVCCCC